MILKKTRITAGILLVLGAVLANIPYALLIGSFDYPAILRAPTGEILTRFAAGGPSLVWTWLAFAWVGLPILLGILLLPRALAADDGPDHGKRSGKIALFFGAAGALAQIFGLLRWPFVVPELARLYADPGATAQTREAVSVVFQAVHRYGGVVAGEHVGQIFTILWMAFLGISLLRKRLFPLWLPLSGFAAAIVYFLAQGELISTSIPGFPYWEAAGLAGSLLWLAWLIALGVMLIRAGVIKGRTGASETVAP